MEPLKIKLTQKVNFNLVDANKPKKDKNKTSAGLELMSTFVIKVQVVNRLSRQDARINTVPGVFLFHALSYFFTGRACLGTSRVAFIRVGPFDC